MSLQCSNCSFLNADRDGKQPRFCARCGRPLSAGVAPPPPRYRTTQEPAAGSNVIQRSEPDAMAITAMVLGILGFFIPVVPLVALILGLVARGRIKGSSGRLTGKGMATAGVVCGSIALLMHMSCFCVRMG